MKTEEKQDVQATVHIPVLLQDVITVLALTKNDFVVDGTLGGGGYTKAILKHLGNDGKVLGIDADESAIERVQRILGNDNRLQYAQGNFRNIDAFVQEAKFPRVDKIVLDLGLSSDQLELRSGRGFSFMTEEPLQMTFTLHPEEEGVFTAWHVVNEWSEESLADIIFGFGGERKSRRIAEAIVQAREEKSIETSKELADIVERVIPRMSGAHPATRTFQAIRIAVNDELGALEEVLLKSKTLLASTGRIAIVTFHSLEDRIVKHTFTAWEKEGFGKRVTKRPIAPSREECVKNKRARSAKLRCFEKA